MAEATLIARIKAVGGKAAAAAFQSLVKALRLLRDSAKQAATPLRQLGKAASSTRDAMKAASTSARAASKSLAAVARSKAGATLVKVAAGARRAAGGLGRMADVINTLNRRLRSMERAADAAISKLRAAGAGIRIVGGQAQASGKKVKGFSQSLLDGGGVLGKFRAALLDAFLIKGIIDGFVQGISRAAKALAGLVAETQKTTIAFTAADIKLRAGTNSLDEYNAATDRLAEVTKRFGVGLLASTEALAEFLAATQRSSLSFEERIGLFESLIQVSRTFNLSNERIKLAFLALTQIASKGAAALEEVRRQLGDQIPGIVPRLAAALGKTVPKLFEDLRAKAVSSEEAVRGLTQAFNELSGEQAFEATRTLAASIGRLNREVDLLKLAFGEATEEGVKQFIDQATQLTRALSDIAVAVGEKGINPLLEFETAVIQAATQTAVLISAFRDGEGVLSRWDVLVGTIVDGLVPWARQLKLVTDRLAPLIELLRQQQLKEAADGIGAIATKLEESAEAAKDLAKEYQDLEDGREKAVRRLREIEDKLRRDIISVAEAERERAKVFEEGADRQRKLREEERREFLRDAEERERVIREASETAQTSAGDQAAAQREIREAIDETTDKAREAAKSRFEVTSIYGGRLVEFETTITDDLKGEFKRRTQNYQIDADEREKIESDLSEKIETLRRKLNEKIFAIREEAQAKLREEGAKEEEILKEQLDKELAARRKANEDAGKILEEGTEKVEKEAEKQAKAFEKAAKKAGDSWRDAFAGIGDGADGGNLSIGTDKATEDVVTFGEALDRVKSKIDALKEQRTEALFAGQDVGPLNKQILDLERNIVRIAQQGVPTFKETFVSGIGAVSDSGKQLLDRIDEITTSNEKWRQQYEGLGADGQASVDRIIATYRSLAENTRITASDTESFGRQLDEAFARGGEASDKLKGKLEEGAAAAEKAGGAQVKLSRDAETGKLSMESLGEAAGDAAQAEEDLGDKAAEVAEKAKIPEEVIQSIRDLGATAETVAPLLDPLVVPLTGMAAAITDLATAVPILPDPLARVADSIIKLVGAEVLKPLAEGLGLIVLQAKPLSEKLPIVAEAQEGFNLAAKESEQPLATLETALQAVAEKELVGRLETLATNLNDVNSKLVALGTEGQGFAKAEAAANSFKEVLGGDDGLLGTIKEFADFLKNDFGRVLQDHAVDWNGPLDAAREYDRIIAGLIVKFPEVATAGEGMFERLDSAGRAFELTLGRIFRKLDDIERKADKLFGEGGDVPVDIPPTPVKTIPAPGGGG